MHEDERLIRPRGDATAGSEFQRLVDIMRRLRGPDGCPWDREQTHESLRPYLIEEAHELDEAIRQQLRPQRRRPVIRPTCIDKLHPIHRRFHQDELTFSLIYAFTENFALPIGSASNDP